MANKQLNPSLTSIFVAYFMSVVLGAIGMGLIAYIGLIVAFRTGFILPANQTENELINLTRSIETDSHFKLSNLPQGTSYLLVDKDGQELQTNMNPQLKKKASSSRDSYSLDHGRYGYFKTFRRPDGSHLIVNYKLRQRYRDPWLEQHLPRLSIVIIGLLSLGLLFYFILTSLFFGRYVKRQLWPIIRMTEKIQEEELEFSLPKTRIKEFDQIIQSLDRLRISLRESLLESWQTKQDQSYQIAALTHDLKTPLTVIKGNTDLLELTDLTEKQADFLSHTKRNIQALDDYLQELTELSQTQSQQVFSPQILTVRDFIESLNRDLKGLATVRGLTFDCLVPLALTDQASWDPKLLKRALINIAANAIEHSPLGTNVSIHYLKQDSQLIITCTDSGPGFSQEALNSAKMPFFTVNSSRSRSQSHQGLGLAIADNIIRLHKGRLELSNTKQGGGRATVILPIVNELGNT
ncbi:sensor histidine kinase [Streptococcus dentasini]